MAFWLTSTRAGQDSDWIQRFDPRFWTINFPRPMMASAIVTAPDGLRIDTAFLTQGDLAGLIWDSADSIDHPLLAYATARDYARCTLSFRWRSGGIVALDAVNGPTLTIEGRDASGVAKSWYVRLWNYAEGTPEDAAVTLPLSALSGGFLLPGEADPVYPSDIDRMFISLVPPGYVQGGTAPLGEPAAGWAELTEIRCDGPGAMLEIGDAIVPPHGLACATDYDDCCNQTPDRVLRNIQRLGYRGSVLHYIGMSHFMPLAAEGEGTDGGYILDPAQDPLCLPARQWHGAFLAACAELGFSPILSQSYELLAQYCPAGWQQCAGDGTPAATGWSPPSTLLSPASATAMGWLQKLAGTLAAMMKAAGVPVRVQIGEPWWWVDSSHRIYLYDAAAQAAFGGNPPAIADLTQPLNAAQIALLDQAGALLATSTAAIRDAVRAAVAPAPAEVLLLVFTPTVLASEMPGARLANLPTGWASPAYDRLQLEDYDWLTAGATGARQSAYAQVNAALAYPPGAQDYLAGFVPAGGDPDLWRRIDAGIDEARLRGAHEILVWALPQICRDGFTHLPEPEPENSEDAMQAFDDISYPLTLGLKAKVSPEFSTAIAVTASGFERRNSLWADARLRFDIGPGVRSEAELGQLLAFFRARRGPARGFRLRDPSDFSSSGMMGTPGATDQWLGTGDGTTTSFPLVKRYGDAGTGPAEAQIRRITRPVAGSVLVSIGGVPQTSGWTLGEGGVIFFATPPAVGMAVEAGFLFDVPVRFAEDSLSISGVSFAAGEAPSVPVIEVREAV